MNKKGRAVDEIMTISSKTNTSTKKNNLHS